MLYKFVAYASPDITKYLLQLGHPNIPGHYFISSGIIVNRSTIQQFTRTQDNDETRHNLKC